MLRQSRLTGYLSVNIFTNMTIMFHTGQACAYLYRNRTRGAPSTGIVHIILKSWAVTDVASFWRWALFEPSLVCCYQLSWFFGFFLHPGGWLHQRRFDQIFHDEICVDRRELCQQGDYTGVISIGGTLAITKWLVCKCYIKTWYPGEKAQLARV